MYVRMDAKRSQASETHLGTPTIKILPLFQQGGSIQEMVRDCLAADQPDPLGLPIRVCNYNEELYTRGSIGTAFANKRAHPSGMVI